MGNENEFLTIAQLEAKYEELTGEKAPSGLNKADLVELVNEVETGEPEEVEEVEETKNPEPKTEEKGKGKAKGKKNKKGEKKLNEGETEDEEKIKILAELLKIPAEKIEPVKIHVKRKKEKETVFEIEHQEEINQYKIIINEPDKEFTPVFRGREERTKSWKVRKIERDKDGKAIDEKNYFIYRIN